MKLKVQQKVESYKSQINIKSENLIKYDKKVKENEERKKLQLQVIAQSEEKIG